jgi:C4-dicarboxylate transporter DctQ subunit
MRKVLEVLNRIEEWTLVFVLLGLAMLSFAEVFCRYLLGFSFTWMEEVGRCVGVFVTFLGASLGVKYGGHFSMDLIYDLSTSHRFPHGLKMVVSVLSGLLFLVVAWYGWEQTMKVRHFGTLTSALQFPKYWAYMPIPIFSILIALRFFILGLRHFKGLIRNDPFSPTVKKL